MNSPRQGPPTTQGGHRKRRSTASRCEGVLVTALAIFGCAAPLERDSGITSNAPEASPADDAFSSDTPRDVSQTDGDHRAADDGVDVPPSNPDASPAADGSGTLDPPAPPDPKALFLNPFNKDSAHHRPVGTGAIYASDGHPKQANWNSWWTSGGSGTINDSNNYGHPIHIENSLDPLQTIAHKACGGGAGQGGLQSKELPVKLRLPASFVPWHNNANLCADRGVTIFSPSTGVVRQFFHFINASGKFQAELMARVDHGFMGLGHSETLGKRIGTSASGMLASCLAMRRHELLAPGVTIGHGFQLAVPRLPSQGLALLGRAIQWPAVSADGSAHVAENNTGKLAYGELLALPPTVDIGALGLSEAGRRFARALRDYGVYVIDGGHTPTLRCDGPLGPLAATLKKEWRLLAPRLRVVLNSVKGADAKVAIGTSHKVVGSSIGTPTWPAGGGAALAPNTAFDAQ